MEVIISPLVSMPMTPTTSPSASSVPTGLTPALSPTPSATISPLSTITPMATSSGTSLNPCPIGTQFITLCNLKVSQLGQYISTIVAIVLVVAILLALFYLLFGGIRWIISGGDKARAESARNGIIAAVIGLILVFLAYFMISVILSFFGISLTQLQLPPLPWK